MSVRPPDTRFTTAFATQSTRSAARAIPIFHRGISPARQPGALLKCAQRTGCIAAEVGIPFSDPLADGPTIQRTGQIASATV